MKCFVLFCLIVGFVYGLDEEFKEKAKEKIKHITEDCMTKTGATADDIAELKSMQPPSRQEGKCFIACFQKHLGVMNENGKLDKNGGEADLAKLKEADEDLYNKAIQVLDKCFEIVEDEEDPCDTALNFAICAHMTAKEVGIDEDVLH